MPTVFSALMCHAPIVIPMVAGPREAARCARTTRAMREIAARAVAAKPDRLILISPHSPRHRHKWAAWSGPHEGDLSAFRAPSLRVSLPDAPEVAASLVLPAVHGGAEGLDHGAMVPLHFLWEAGWRGPTAILALPWAMGEDRSPEEIGRALAALPGRSAIIASGDMSHRLIPGAPSGYDPIAQRFDDAFVAGLEADDWPAAIKAEARERAAEDVVDSTRVAMGAAGAPRGAEVLSYEGPWGVGYTEAVLYEESSPLWALARRAIRDCLEGRATRVDPFGPPSGAFVTLTEGGKLRGCIGHIAPTRGSLSEEIVEVAPLAALEDPRFDPVLPEELALLEVEISVLSPPEPIAGPEDLDPAIYGVIVSHAGRRGLLLPDLEGVNTVEAQIDIARRKAGIPAGVPLRLERFEVRKEKSP